MISLYKLTFFPLNYFNSIPANRFGTKKRLAGMELIEIIEWEEGQLIEGNHNIINMYMRIIIVVLDLYHGFVFQK